MVIPNLRQIISYSSDLLRSGQEVKLLGRVIASFPLCLYVRTTANAIVCIADKSLDNGPARIRVDFSNPSTLQAREGDLVKSHQAALYLGNHTILSNRQAESWSPPPVSSMASREGIHLISFLIKT